jgi:acyl dehydratase
MQFSTPPRVALWRAALRWRSRSTLMLPRLEASAERVPLAAHAYAQVCGFGHSDPLPVTYPDVACRGLQLAVLTAPAFPFRLLGLVHTHQRLEQWRALRADEGLSARVFVDGLEVVRRGAQFALTTELRAGAEVVWRGVSTILTRSVPGDGVVRERTPEPAYRVERTADWALPANLGRQYARVSGDSNPIHLWRVTAWPFGFPRPIAHGWWLLARCLAQLADEVPGRCTVEASFRRPVPLPSTVTFAAGRSDGALAFSLASGAVCLSGTVREGPALRGAALLR